MEVRGPPQASLLRPIRLLPLERVSPGSSLISLDCLAGDFHCPASPTPGLPVFATRPICLFFTCVLWYVCVVYGHVHVSVCTLTCVCVCRLGDHRMFSSVTTHLNFRDRVSHQTWFCQAGWPMNSRATPSLSPSLSLHLVLG